MTHLYSRECVSIALEGPHPKSVTHMFTELIAEDTLVFRTLFSLAGTLPETSCLNLLPSTLALFDHPGYSSIVKVEATGSNLHLRVGDILLIPFYHQTYGILTEKYRQETRNFFLLQLTLEQELISVLFTPLISFAQYLLKQMPETTKQIVLFADQSLLGSLLFKLILLEYTYLDVTICINETDPLHTYLFHKKDCRYATYQTLEPKQFCSSELCIFALSSSQSVQQLISVFSLPAEQCIFAYPVTGTITRHLPWLRRDALGEALAILSLSDLTVGDLIDQHVHAESIVQVYHAISENHYRGRAVIYDW